MNKRIDRTEAGWLARFLLCATVLIGFLIPASPVSASTLMYDAVLSQELMQGPDLCAHAPCADVLPGAQEFSKRKGMPSYVEAYAQEGGEKRVVGYVFLSTDIVDIPAYSGKPIITLIGMDTRGIITGVRILKHSEPILLAGLPESVLVTFIRQYLGKSADAKLEIGDGRDGVTGLDGISGATVTAIAENQVISRSAYDIARQVGIIKAVPRPAARFTAVDERLDWNALLKEGSIEHLRVEAKDVGAPEDGQPYIDLYYGYLNAPAVGKSILGEHGYKRLMQDLQAHEHAIFIVANGQSSFKGSGFVRGGIYDRIQVRQDPMSFTFRDTDYLNLYQLLPAGAPQFKESGIFIIRSASFNPAWPWDLSFLANKADAQKGTKTFTHFDREYWLPARYLEGGRPHVERPQPAWKAIWNARLLDIGLFTLILAATALLYSQRDRLVRASNRKHKPLISVPRTVLWIASVGFIGFYLKAQPSITQVMTWFHSLIHQWKWELFLSDPFIFIFWWFMIVTVALWGRGLFCGWLCPFGSLQHLAYKLGGWLGLKRFQRLLPKALHDKLKWIKYVVFAVLVGVSFYSMEAAETLAEIEPFKTTFLVGIWNRSWPFVLFVTAILGISILSERPYCKYLCPLGAGLAIPGKFRLFGLKRKSECQTCHACAAGCGSHAIDAKGNIDQKECLLCLDCMVMYYDDHACPPLVKERKNREKQGLPLTRIDAKGYFVPLESVRRHLHDKAAEVAARPE
ncbi:MAG TPA: 4Fe-4S binding protein [Noviherbaspirillum sp.]|uniref:4Fe-4S binding protein n=1 Tax=Noviherbaspirillum sp. TaxID=1926288 RepID=UPI002D746234|nr:4Fe-4S binding protein [Noviherbaspirillum sp.]HYD95886.1 4Fe-4S binding protein [Noviherbaspirillum sp.]